MRKALMTHENYGGRSSSCQKVKEKLTGTKIRRTKQLVRIAKINMKSVEDEIQEEMSGGEEDLQ
jgi:hypothetical protein